MNNAQTTLHTPTASLDADGLEKVMDGLLAIEAAMMNAITSPPFRLNMNVTSVLCRLQDEVSAQLSETYEAAKLLALSSEDPEEIQTASETALKYIGATQTESLATVASLSEQFAASLQRARHAMECSD